MLVLAQQSALDAAQVIAVLTGFVIPLLVGLLTKLNAARWIKAVLNLALSALAAALADVIPSEFNWTTFAFTFAVTWATSVASYYGLLKPAGVSQQVQHRTAQLGIS